MPSDVSDVDGVRRRQCFCADSSSVGLQPLIIRDIGTLRIHTTISKIFCNQVFLAVRGFTDC